jgi:hypothetical protein
MDIRFDNDDKILVVRGINFDKVSIPGDICPDSEGSNTHEVVREWNVLATWSRNIYQTPDRKGPLHARYMMTFVMMVVFVAGGLDQTQLESFRMMMTTTECLQLWS